MAPVEKKKAAVPPLVAEAASTPARSETQLEMGAQGRTAMRNVALDLGNRITYARAEGGAVVERRVFSSLAEAEPLLGPKTTPARVAVEASREAWFVHDTLTSWGHEVTLVDTTRVRELGIGHHKRKNDRIDAGLLALAVEKGVLPKAHLLSPARRKLREQLGLHRGFTESRASFAVQLRGLLRARGIRLPTCAVARLPGMVKEHCAQAEQELLKPLSTAIEQLTAVLREVDLELERLAAEEPAILRLKTVPGVATIVAAAFVSVIDDAKRFDRAHQVEAYVGLVPSEHTSGRRKLGSITKQGNSYLRALLVQAAWSIVRARQSTPLKTWALAVMRRRGKQVGVVALARRLAGVLWAIWYEGTVFEAARIGRASAEGLTGQARQIEATAERLRGQAQAAEFVAAALAGASRKTLLPPVRQRKKVMA
jgi:transposase